MTHPLLLAMLGTGFTFLTTAIGAALVFFLPDDAPAETHRSFLGFAAGVMIAASVWSLLIPAQEMAAEHGMSVWISPALGFLSGGVFLCLADRLPDVWPGLANQLEGRRRGTALLTFAVTLHNLPEGMAVGLSFAVAALSGEETALAGAAALALGVGLQNLPEGAAISLPLRSEGMKKRTAFWYGTLSGIVEPLGGLAGVVLALRIGRAMPFLLSFAAGAMIYVVVQELVPEARGESEGGHAGTLGAMSGFVLMMTLDVALK